MLTLAASQAPAPVSSLWKAPCALITLADPLGSFWAEPAQQTQPLQSSTNDLLHCIVILVAIDTA